MDHREHQEEIVAQRRPIVGIVLSSLALIGLAYLVVIGGEPADEAYPAPTEPTTSTTAPSPTTTSAPNVQSSTTMIPTGPASSPAIDGVLAGGGQFVVYEPTPGVLCAVIDDSSGEICHLELVTASGAAVIDTRLAFGYLSPGASSASLRYRTSGVSNDGIRIEQDARFFALPITGADPYRLQYRTADFDIANEVPLVALRGGAAQSPGDATAQGVPPSVAELPFNRRVQVIQEWTRFIEGPYAWSSLPTPSIEPGWAEFLQLDTTGTEIVRSVPLPNVRLNAMLGTRDALYLIGQQVTTADQRAVTRGEARFPVIVARIQRPRSSNTNSTSPGATIRVFPQAPIGDEPALAPDVSRPGWQLGPELPTIDPFAIGGVGGRIQIDGDGEDGAPILLDPVTLLPTGA